MLADGSFADVLVDPRSARRVLITVASSCIMSQRAHFWLRIVGLAVILAAEFGPRLRMAWTVSPTAAPSSATATADLR
jgi:uncharacterized membrane protein